ncbi:MAG: prolipoprotein diacylglyceryl transferase [Verrucomicrobiae bacterium]|nr:prolipoprotein diacylglyceryl transferase [Verrucomicrobiae bacterium]
MSSGPTPQRGAFRGIHALNAFLDTLPRTRTGRFHRPVPAFRTCGIVGFYLALLTLFAGGLLTGRSLVILAAVALVSGLSFFAYTYLRKWITGREELVLLEHVWFAFACNALALHLLNQPLLPYLDLISVALCPFLAMGRVGCTLVGCCHGQPSSLGIAYPESCAADGFPPHLVGVRLFPAPALEGLGLVLIGLAGFIALPFAVPGRVFAWFLLAYAIMRFGLEGIRGDPRPHFLGLSQARWMGLAEAGLALGLGMGSPSATTVAIGFALLITLAAVLVHQHRRNPHALLMASEHVQEMRNVARAAFAPDAHTNPLQPSSHTTSRGATLACSSRAIGPYREYHLSLGLPGRANGIPLLCRIAAAAFPQLLPLSARISQGGYLHLLLAAPPGLGTDTEAPANLADNLHGAVLRRLQHEADTPPLPGPEGPATESIEVPESRVADPVPQASPTRPQSPNPPWYFSSGNGTRT